MDGLRRVLCAEDDPDIRTILELSLAAVGGYEVCMCNDGQAAVEQAPGFRPDLILFDVMMPGMTGPEAMQAIRAMPELRGTPVVLMSARALPHEIEALLEHGATGVIVKPFDPMTLADNLRIYWEHGRGIDAG
ncbi:response regulator [Ralstonia solanacearum]|uniref:response regulator n=1 Tax=Ralstonia solanacearum TaxID=305 RepID=UPI0005C6CEF1|nr:response regulator [Ralstonia solanacearum]MDB0542236.1 response regulator [Ralstonia solanacearum]MDB0552492.1 response regulator [Ralstonia solanacearum]MDB0557200.1 response regulator [Ralstonia solanacearum]